MFNPTPPAFTNLGGGISITLPDRSAPRTVICLIDVLVNPSHLKCSVGLDGVSYRTVTSNAPADSDGNSSQNGGVPVVIPGDGNSHTITIMISAQGSTAASTITQALLFVLDVGA
ncbi:MAG: hypothetical protein ACYDAY_12060 [Candidatus Dormibacteria bacterium]